MHFFRYAQDYYGDWLAVQLLPDAARLLIWFVAVFIGIHLLRRSWGEPIASTPADPVTAGGDLHKYTLGARLYQWGNFLLIFVLAASGWALFVPRSLKSPVSSWILIHEISSGLFIAGLLLHIVAALTRGERRSMRFSRED